MSYQSLESYVFAFDGDWGSFYKNKKTGGSRTTPGRFGSRESGFYKAIAKPHYDVSLTKEEMRRITLWLDLNANELGAYKNVDAQKNGELVWPEWDSTPDNPQGVEFDRPVPDNTSLKEAYAGQKRWHVEFNQPSGKLHLVFGEPGDYRVSIYEISGKKLISQPAGDAKSMLLSTGALKQGVYLISLESPEFSEYRKFTVY